MLAIVAALGAALAWGVSAACDNRSTRMIGSLQALAWVQLIGLAQVLREDGFTPVAYAFPGGSMGNAIVDDLAPMIPITRGITYLPK